MNIYSIASAWCPLCEPSYLLSVDGHFMACPERLNVTLIKFDVASRHLSLLVDSIQILSDQRYSFLLTANQPISNYWFRAD